jgi:predicted phage replisome organizer/uncharacterized phage protein (TIGR02220 family)
VAKKEKKYYYLKLKDDFFEREEIQILEAMPDGYLYCNILMKLYLRSLKSDGRLMYRGVIPYTPEVLATLTRHSVGVVKSAIDAFRNLGLLEVLDNGAMYMLDVENFVGQSSDEADRVRLYRAKIQAEKLALQAEQETDELPAPDLNKLPLEEGGENSEGVQMYDICNKKSDHSQTVEPQGIQELSTGKAYICTPENRDKENRDKENREYNINNVEPSSPAPTSSKRPAPPYEEIIAYLNQVAGKSFSHKTKETQRLIKARWNEGYTLEQFKTVIDVKSSQWLHKPEMLGYLRPMTLFSTKFESYLNEAAPRPAANQQQPAQTNGNMPEWAVEGRRKQEITKKNEQAMTPEQSQRLEKYSRRLSELILMKLNSGAELTPEQRQERADIKELFQSLERVDFWQTDIAAKMLK